MTTKQAKFVKAKLEGKSNTQAALEAVPNLAPSSASTTGMRLSRDVDVQQALQAALNKHNITIDKVAQRVAEGMDALKQNAYTGEVIEDIPTRLKATMMASDLLGLKGNNQPPKPDKIDPNAAKELAEAIRSGDEVRVTQAVWNAKEGN